MPQKNNEHSILIVDDVAINIQILKGLLIDEYKILAAKNGRRAIDIAQNTPQPDLILLDVVMPLMDGFEVCQLLKGNPKTKHIPIIFITGKTEKIDESLGFELGAADYVSKLSAPAIIKYRVKAQLSLSLHNRDIEAQVSNNICA